jgi:hypothetical protein
MIFARNMMIGIIIIINPYFSYVYCDTNGDDVVDDNDDDDDVVDDDDDDDDDGDDVVDDDDDDVVVDDDDDDNDDDHDDAVFVDLVFILLDRPDESHDKLISEHIMNNRSSHQMNSRDDTIMGQPNIKSEDGNDISKRMRRSQLCAGIV